MSSSVETIKEKLDIAQVIGAYIKLEKAGANYKAKCPFHTEKTPSFFISTDRGSYYCFGCGAKGDIFNFVQEFEGLDFIGALKVLAEKAGVELVPENKQVKSERDRLFSIMEVSAQFFENKFSESGEAQNYIAKRGLHKNTVKDWRIGYAPDSWRDCYSFLKSKGYSDTEMEKAGMIKRADDSRSTDKFYDRFRGRVMFPIFDSAGRVIAFSGRILNADDKSAKYLNSPETPLFHKSSTLYGLHKAKNDIRSKDYSILVEGQMDLLSAHQAKFANTVASSGTAFTEQHMEILKRLSSRIILAFDPDAAGVSAAEKSARLAMSLGMEVKVAMMPEGLDPADLIIKNPKGWADALRNSKHIISYVLDRVLEKKLDGRNLGKEVRSGVLPFVEIIDSNIEKSHFVTEISGKTGIKEVAIWDDLKKIEKERKDATKASGSSNGGLHQDSDRKESVLRADFIKDRIAGFLLWKNTSPVGKAEAQKTEQRLKEVLGDEEFARMMTEAQATKDRLIFEAEAYFENNKNFLQEIDDLTDNFEEEHIRNLREAVMVEIKKDEKSGSMERIPQLSKRFNELSETLTKKFKK